MPKQEPTFAWMAMNDNFIRDEAQTTQNATFLKEVEDKFKAMRTTDHNKIAGVWKALYNKARSKQDLVLYRQLRNLNRKFIDEGKREQVGRGQRISDEGWHSSKPSGHNGLDGQPEQQGMPLKPTGANGKSRQLRTPYND